MLVGHSAITALTYNIRRWPIIRLLSEVVACQEGLKQRCTIDDLLVRWSSISGAVEETELLSTKYCEVLACRSVLCRK